MTQGQTSSTLDDMRQRRPDPTSRRERTLIKLAAQKAVERAAGQLHDDTPDHQTLATLADLAQVAETAAHEYVTVMRDDGAPWSVIGNALSVTRQAAQQRFGRKLPAGQHRGPALFDLPGTDDVKAITEAEPALSGYCNQRQHSRCRGFAKGRPCSCACHQ